MKTLIITSTIALIAFCSFAQSAQANLSAKKDSFSRDASQTHYLFHETYEKPVMVEEWMKNISHFNSYFSAGFEEQEIHVETWMYNPDYFLSPLNYSENETIISIESWMTDPGYFYNSINETNREKAIIIENWMLDINYFLSDMVTQENRT